jgi:uncharacterized protein
MSQYHFSWDQLGDIAVGRPNLGMHTRVETYRLMQYTMRAILVEEFGEEKTAALLASAGRLSGIEFCNNLLNKTLPLNEFLASVHERLLEFNIGVLKIEKINPETLHTTATVSEDLDCSGLPVTGVTVCDYDEGFLEGVFSTYTGEPFTAKEIDCWSTGDRTCRFQIQPKL